MHATPWFDFSFWGGAAMFFVVPLFGGLYIRFFGMSVFWFADAILFFCWPCGTLFLRGGCIAVFSGFAFSFYMSVSAICLSLFFSCVALSHCTKSWGGGIVCHDSSCINGNTSDFISFGLHGVCMYIMYYVVYFGSDDDRRLAQKFKVENILWKTTLYLSILRIWGWSLVQASV